MANDPVIEISSLTKWYGRKEVLRGVDLRVPRGSIFGFLGLNGSGKSTTIRTMLGMTRPNRGTIRVLGRNPARDPIGVRQRIGYMAENQTMYGWMTVGEIIAWMGRFYPTWDDDLSVELRKQLELDAGARVGDLSKGQTSKLALLLALAHKPELVILDDPALGLDPIARRELLREIIGQLQARAVTVFFSSHLLYEIEPICDRVAILHEGRIITSESVDALKERVRRFEFLPRGDFDPRHIAGLLDVRSSGELVGVTVADSGTAGAQLGELSRNGVATVELSLDEIFEAYVVGRKELR